MENLNFITSSYFWQNVYLISKWIFILLSLVLTTGIILLIIKISNFRQKLNIYKVFQERGKITDSGKNKKEPIAALNKISESIKSKWNEIIVKIESDSEKDWKMSIIEADSLLDIVLKRKGYPGETTKERLKAVSTEKIINLDDVWTAHKIRNEIAHNPEFSLTKIDAAKFLKIYKKALEDLNVM